MLKYNTGAFFLGFVISILIFSGCSNGDRNIMEPIDYVDVFLGTSNSRWMLGPYATMPFGMVKLGPDNQGDQWMGGYEYAVSRINQWGKWNDYTLYFVLKFDTPFDQMDGFHGTEVDKNVNEYKKEGDTGAYVTFSTDEGQVIKMHSGILTGT